MSRRILLADDSLTIQKVVELTFADTDFEVHAVSSGDELIAKLPEARPDIVICDIIMPGRDGYDVCQEIKSSPEYLHLPVILLTGTFEPFDRDRALAVGCSEIITKPFEAKRLVEAVERLTSGAGASHQPTGAARQPEVFDDGRVTPPPPITAPDELVDVESDYDLADTAITAESSTAARTAETTETVEEGLDFTMSGFSEMETAGRERAERVLEAPSEGLDFEIETVAQGADSVMDTAPFRHEDIAAEAFRGGAADDPFATPEIDAVAASSLAADGDPFPDADEQVFGEPEAAPDLDRNLTTPINVAEVMRKVDAAPPVHDRHDPVPADDEIDESNADTQDIGTRPETPPAAPAPPDAPSGLSDEDVDRIAHRLLELAGDRIDRIAWEVVPDMAEIVVRERVREIEAETVRHGS
jgi:CheY-like chemotaxis protein